jgi:hypothetical protein
MSKLTPAMLQIHITKLLGNQGLNSFSQMLQREGIKHSAGLLLLVRLNCVQGRFFFTLLITLHFIEVLVAIFPRYVLALTRRR